MVEVILTSFARDDAENLFLYHFSFSPNVAQTLRKEIIMAAHRLRFFPEMGPLEPSLEHLERNYRYVLVQHRYKMIYLFENEVCSILMIWDCKKNPKLLLSSEVLRAEGVFKKAKPFGGQASSFLDKLTREIIPETEKHLGVVDAERTLLGVSLSGLFAVWAAFHTDHFSPILLRLDKALAK